MENNITIIGSKNDVTKASLLLSGRNDLEKIYFNKQNLQFLNNNPSNGIIVMANRRTVGSASKVLEHMQMKKPDVPVVIISTIKDADLLYYALKANVVDFVIDNGNHESLKLELDKSLYILKEKTPTKRILAIGAHPDDIEIGCGGTLLKHQKQKHKVSILTLTMGSNGGEKAKRVREAENAANHLGAELFMHDLEDTKLSEGNPTIQVIQEAIKIAKPDIIYTHSYNDNHQDHRATHKATLVASRGVKNVYAYLAPSTNVAFHPRHYEVIDNYISEKQRLINYHVSQTTEKARPYLKPEVIESTATYWGRFKDYSLCEPYEVIKS